jgi:hypothetical protein
LFRRHIITDQQAFSGKKNLERIVFLIKILEILFISENETLKPEEIVYMDGNMATKIYMKNISNLNFIIPPKPMKLEPKL